MNIYFTVSSAPEATQSSPQKSLGRYISSTQPKNDDFGNLFSDLSMLSIRNARTEYVALMIRNELGVPATNVKIWSERPETSYTKYLMAGIVPAKNVNGDWQMEQVRDRYSRPFMGDFYEATVDDKIEFGTVAPDDVIAVWVAREFLVDYIKEDSLNVYEPDPDNQNRYIPTQKGKSDTISIKISWD